MRREGREVHGRVRRGIVVKVSERGGLETHLHVDASEASVVAELATGRAVANVSL